MEDFEKELAPYSLALRLKAIGFDFSVMAWSDVYTDHIIIMNPDNWCNMNIRKDCVSRPTFSQAFRWFKKEYKIHVSYGTTSDYDEEMNGFVISNYIDGSRNHLFRNWEVGTYEEAELACLEKLLEIVESKSE